MDKENKTLRQIMTENLVKCPWLHPEYLNSTDKSYQEWLDKLSDVEFLKVYNSALAFDVN